MKRFLAVILLMTSLSSQAMDTGGYYKITKLWVWGGNVGGVVLIQLENINSNCPNGYWLKDSPDSGSKNMLSVILSAYHAKTPVMIYADENSDWSGLAAKECEIGLIGFSG